MTEFEPKRRWFSFSIRDLFWLALAASLITVWRLDHAKIQEERDDMVRAKAGMQEERDGLARTKIELLEQQKVALRRYIKDNGVHITPPAPESWTIPILIDQTRP
jgi:hypothetical protein